MPQQSILPYEKSELFKTLNERFKEKLIKIFYNIDTYQSLDNLFYQLEIFLSENLKKIKTVEEWYQLFIDAAWKRIQHLQTTPSWNTLKLGPNHKENSNTLLLSGDIPETLEEYTRDFWEIFRLYSAFAQIPKTQKAQSVVRLHLENVSTDNTQLPTFYYSFLSTPHC